MNKLIYKILSCYLLKISCIRKNIFLLIFFSYKFIYKTLFKYAIGGNFVKAYPKEAIFSHTFLFFKTLTFDLVDKKREERFLKNNVISHLHHIILIQIFTLNFLIFHPPHNQTRPKTREGGVLRNTQVPYRLSQSLKYNLYICRPTSLSVNWF